MEQRMGRVEMGVGAFHNPPRARYSEETRNLIKVLMDESRLTMMQRKKIQDAVDKGESLPLPTTKLSKLDKQKFAEAQVTFPCVWKRRSHDAIVSSGAYEREQYRRTDPLPNQERQKRHLACMMAYGKDMPPTPHGPKILHRARRQPEMSEDADPLQDLVRGIRERIEFLTEMENLGEGKKYRPIMQQEIAEKIRLLESVDERRSEEVERMVARYKYERLPPKPFPLGELDER